MLWRIGGWSTVSGTSNFFDLMWGQFWPYLLCFCLAGITWMCGSENEWGQYYGMVCTWLARLMVKWWSAITGPLHYVAIKGRVQTKWNFHKSILFILNSENTFFSNPWTFYHFMRCTKSNNPAWWRSLAWIYPQLSHKSVLESSQFIKYATIYNSKISLSFHCIFCWKNKKWGCSTFFLIDRFL